MVRGRARGVLVGRAESFSEDTRAPHPGRQSCACVQQQMELAAEPLLLATLRRDHGDHVVKYLHPFDVARLEQSIPRDDGAGEALMRAAAGRRHAAAAKKGATLALLGEGRGGRITWATELLWIYMAMARLRVNARGAKMLSCGQYHSLVTSGKEGALWSFGRGVNGMLGHGDTLENEAVPRLIEALNRAVVVQVSAGLSHSMALTRDGGVFTWGDGGEGQLGHSNTDHRDATMSLQRVPKQVLGLVGTHIIDIAVGSIHSLAVCERGALYTWGYNYQGQLGLGYHGTDTDRPVPTVVEVSAGVGGVVAVAAGAFHSLALSRDGTVIAAGTNSSGQLGLGDKTNRNTFTLVGPPLRGVVDIDAGQNHSVAVTVEGKVWSWGEGQATGMKGLGCMSGHVGASVPCIVHGRGIDEAMVVQVAAGKHHSMALTAEGDLYTWGQGDRGELGHGGRESLVEPRVVDGIKGTVVGMAGGTMHSLVTTRGGRVLAFGTEPSGACGLGAGVIQARSPTTIDGIIMGEGVEGEGRE